MEEVAMFLSSGALGVPVLIATMLAAPALAQQGGGQGGAGQGGPPPSAAGVNLSDRDRVGARDQDRDRLYLGSQDRLRQHDRDGDGSISREEFRQWHEDSYRAIDADGSAGFSLQEFLAVRLGPGPRGGDPSSRRERVEERAKLRKTERFRLMDGNGDGIVTRDEYMNFGELNYLDADRDDDGRLSMHEMQDFHRGW
jgi:hypothetical protein